MPVISAMQEAEVRGSQSKADLNKRKTYLKNNSIKKRLGAWFNVPECLSSRYKALSSNTSTLKKMKSDQVWPTCINPIVISQCYLSSLALSLFFHCPRCFR
jgi:hypothetical protein